MPPPVSRLACDRRRSAAGGIRATEGEEGTDGPRGTRVRLIGLITPTLDGHATSGLSVDG